MLLSITATAKERAPSWVADWKSAFPDSAYIAQRGTGKSAELARTDALGLCSSAGDMKADANRKELKQAQEEDVLYPEQIARLEAEGAQYSKAHPPRRTRRGRRARKPRRSKISCSNAEKRDEKCIRVLLSCSPVTRNLVILRRQK